MKSVFLRLCLLYAVLSLSGCAGIARGVTEAVLERKAEDTRQCEVTGPRFSGVAASLAQQEPSNPHRTTKVLAVHGISKHLPGYSTRLKSKLVRELGLDLVSDTYKEIRIRDARFANADGTPEEIGILRITQHLNRDRTKELLFYELTWSQISDPDKAELAFDNSVEYGFRRADANNLLKTFLNGTIPDLLVYRGSGKEKINAAVEQAICWTFSGDWNDLPDKASSSCNAKDKDMSRNILDDDYFFVTHSLGSRITIDTIAHAAQMVEQGAGDTPFFRALRQKEFTVFMLSNQLPLLQIGMEKPVVTGQADHYCRADGDKYDDRIFSRLNVVAFSDPNDVLSYPIPSNYAAENLDSRLCARVVNVDINVTPVNDSLGIAFANPLEAHGGYWDDDRVVSLIKDGMSREEGDAPVPGRCRWTESVDGTP